MKFLILLSIFVSTNASSAEILRDVLDRHNEERHFEKKKWDINKNECKATYPQYYESSHPDYDKHFECQKRVKADMNAFEDKQLLELCQKFRIKCKD